jgi:hypothetical protein
MRLGGIIGMKLYLQFMNADALASRAADHRPVGYLPVTQLRSDDQ